MQTVMSGKKAFSCAAYGSSTVRGIPQRSLRVVEPARNILQNAYFGENPMDFFKASSIKAAFI